jgi:hypothetical protein
LFLAGELAKYQRLVKTLNIKAEWFGSLMISVIVFIGPLS